MNIRGLIENVLKIIHREYIENFTLCKIYKAYNISGI